MTLETTSRHQRNSSGLRVSTGRSRMVSMHLSTSMASHASYQAHALGLEAEARVGVTVGALAHRVGEHVGHIAAWRVLGGVAASVADAQGVLAVDEEGRVVLDVRAFPVVEPLSGHDVALAVVREAHLILDAAGDC